MKQHSYYVYILASLSGTLYVGMTNSVKMRSWQHQKGLGSIFTRRYGVNRLVYYDHFQYVLNAIARETQIKKWRRSKKVVLIESMNPHWRDLSKDFGKEFKPTHPFSDRDSSLRSE